MAEEKLEQKPGTSPLVKVEQKADGKKTWLTAEDIITAFKKGDPNGVASYNQLCVALENFPKWEEAPRMQFIKKFYGCAHELDDKCELLVKKLLTMSMSSIPTSERDPFIGLLRQVAVRQVSQTERIFNTFVINFMPHSCFSIENGTKDESWPFAVSEADQEYIYTLVHNAIRQSLRVFPMSTKLIMKCIAKNYPHFSVNRIKYLHFFRNVVMLIDYLPRNFQSELWSFLISKLIAIDTIASTTVSESLKNERKNSGIFTIQSEQDDIMDMEIEHSVSEICQRTDAERLDDNVEKLDKCIFYIIGWISRFYTPILNMSNAAHLAWLPPLDIEQKENLDLFELFKPAFFDYVLSAHDIHSVPFIWIYMASIDKNISSKILSSLWSVVIRPSQSPNDWRRAHSAACFLAAFLARAKTFSLSVTLQWLAEMSNWCTRYINEVAGGLMINSTGSMRHGTFYAVCQATFLVFCFRYKQIVEADALNNVQKWGFGHIVHCCLNPLLYINRPVALCFAAISRSLQIVYCNHLLSNVPDSSKPFESSFPFDVCVLRTCSEYVSNCIQKFSPMQNDISLISTELLRGQISISNKIENTMNDDDDDPDAFAFMFGDDNSDYDGITGGKSLQMSIPSKSQAFTQYSQSPGLCNMEFV